MGVKLDSKENKERDIESVSIETNELDAKSVSIETKGMDIESDRMYKRIRKRPKDSI